MSLWVACTSCRESFDAETHAGLVRCDGCVERKAYRLSAAPPLVVEVAA